MKSKLAIIALIFLLVSCGSTEKNPGTSLENSEIYKHLSESEKETVKLSMEVDELSRSNEYTEKKQEKKYLVNENSVINELKKKDIILSKETLHAFSSNSYLEEIIELDSKIKLIEENKSFGENTKNELLKQVVPQREFALNKLIQEIPEINSDTVEQILNGKKFQQYSNAYKELKDTTLPETGEFVWNDFVQKYKFSEDTLQNSIENTPWDFLFTDTPVPQEVVMQQLLEENWITEGKCDLFEDHFKKEDCLSRQ